MGLHDKIKVAAIDCDGILRGKVMHKSKFLTSLHSRFRMSSVMLGWDMHDVLFTEEPKMVAEGTSYKDLTASINLDSFRRLPFEDNIAFFLLQFAIGSKLVAMDGRSLTQSLIRTMASQGFKV
ncbi:hypothetical protein QQZ08_003695 [Neonectria magnoliae]|uniref:Uncharacterized protein n=1 Tax=Neonectria magnoliae TaxID=2732573 RepID=A0ABR1I8Q0_9HYPO